MKLLVSSKMHIISKIQRGIDFKRIINGFQRKWNFPQCLGAIDSTHIPIKAPLVHHADYYNRKCFYSVILRGVCDSQCCFTDVFAGWPGRAHNFRVFGHSQIGILIIEGRLIPDYSNLRWVIDNHVDKVVLHATTACILHNMCEERKECYLEEWNRLGEDEIGDLPGPDPLNDDDADSNSNIIRNILAHFLYND